MASPERLPGPFNAMMNLHGADVYIRSATTPDLPKTFESLKLVLISNRGTRVYPPPAPEIRLFDWPRCRYVSDQKIQHETIEGLLATLRSEGFHWTKVEKLYRDGDVNLYSEAY